MKQGLTVGERFALLGILPSEGNFATLKIVRRLRESLTLTEGEYKEYGVKEINTSNGNSLSWNSKKANIEVKLEFGDMAVELIRTKLKELDDKKKLDSNHYTIYEKFVETKEAD